MTLNLQLLIVDHTVTERRNVTGNMLLECLGNAKGNAKRMQKTKRSILGSWERILEANKFKWNAFPFAAR